MGHCVQLMLKTETKPKKQTKRQQHVKQSQVNDFSPLKIVVFHYSYYIFKNE